MIIQIKKSESFLSLLLALNLGHSKRLMHLVVNFQKGGRGNDAETLF